MYVCPYANRCGFPVSFRVVTTEREVFLYTDYKHTPDSHSAEQSIPGLTLPQKEAVQSAVRMHPMAGATDVRRNLHLVEKNRRDVVYICSGK
jgi:hypothetical protein